MTWIALFLFSLIDSPQITYDLQEVFEPVRREEFALGQNGEIYILDYDNKRIVHFDEKGTILNTFGGAGEGPGEFEFPRYLTFEKDKLYVVDKGQDRITVFSPQGKTLDTYALPKHVRNIVKVQNGWVYDYSVMAPPGGDFQPVKIFIAGNKFEDPTELLSFEQGAGARGIQIEITGNSRPVAKYNPVAPMSGMAASSDGAYAFIQLPEGFQIKVIDAKTRKVVKDVKRQLKGIPFNEEYGNVQVDDLAQRAKAQHSPVTFEGDFPDRFPIIRQVFPTAQGNLGIRHWTAKPDDMEHISIMNAKGENITPGFTTLNTLRVYGVQDGFAYVNAYDEENDAHIVRVPLDKVDAFIEANPMEMDVQARVYFRTDRN